MKLSDYPKRILLIYGISMAITMMAYFLICHFLGVAHLTYLRSFNLVILAVGVYLSMRQFKLANRDKINFFKAIGVGLASVFIGVTIFVLLLFIVLTIDQPLFIKVVEHEPLGGVLNIYVTSMIIWMQGIFAGITATFIVVNFIKTDDPRGQW